MNSFRIIQGDAIEELARLPPESVDSMVTDPPAGIGFMGSEWDTFEPAYQARMEEREEARKSLGPHSDSRPGRSEPRSSSAFGTPAGYAGSYDPKGRDGFIAAMTAVFVESLRVLKPGAHALVWAIPRTSHWTATALENSGFEIRDVVMHLFGTGFPKSLDVSKAIDTRSDEEIESGVEPAPEVIEWAGSGTALKPAAEHWILCRKPLIGTVAANVLEHGTGAINVDGCRIDHGGGESPIERRRRYAYETNPENAAESQGRGKIRHRGDPAKRSEPRPGDRLGRWPANVVLSHSDGCVLVGEKRVETGTAINRNRSGTKPNTIYGEFQCETEDAGHADADGLETVPAYQCVESCPVRMLDEQSGELSSGGTPPSRPRDKTQFAYGAFGGQENPNGIGGSSGTASRFFYCAKPSTAERNVGQTENRHPTVKGAELMQYLCRLITPAEGTVLDPFVGSGSTGIAALREGFDFVGIEREAEYVELARNRITGDAPLFNREDL